MGLLLLLLVSSIFTFCVYICVCAHLNCLGLASCTKLVTARTDDLTNASHASILEEETEQVSLSEQTWPWRNHVWACIEYSYWTQHSL